jgi:phosphopantothenoylcysteine decarboxylase/phosphopantothenate--cysteine ligase
MGAEVTVVAAGTTAQPPHGVRTTRVRTSAEMAAALKASFAGNDVLVMAAAVSDFRPAEKSEAKIKGESLTLDLTRTEDILASLGGAKGTRMIVGFALETDDVEANALDKMRKKNCDLIVVNDPLEEGAAFTHDTNVVTIYNARGKVYESDGPEPKRAIARKILELVAAEEAFKKLGK